MQLDQFTLKSQEAIQSAQSIAQTNTGMSVGCRIDNNGSYPLFAGSVDALNKRPFVVALKAFQFNSGTFGQTN